MSQLDVGEPSRTEAVAERVDDFRLAHKLVREVVGPDESLTILDVVRLAEFLGEG